MNTPLDHLQICMKPPTRAAKILLTKPTKATHPFLFLKGNICERTGSMIPTRESIFTARPKLRSNEELWEIFNITALNFLSRGSIILKLKELFKNLIGNEDFSTINDILSVPDMFIKVKKGSKKYREILIEKTKTIYAPK